jgi:hypothetical protein
LDISALAIKALAFPRAASASRLRARLRYGSSDVSNQLGANNRAMRSDDIRKQDALIRYVKQPKSEVFRGTNKLPSGRTIRFLWVFFARF